MTKGDYPGVKAKKDLAEQALEDANLVALKQLFDDAMNDIDTILAGINVMLDGRKLGPLPSDSGIQAMRDVSLAAIDLAKLVATRQNGRGDSLRSSGEI